MIETSDLKPLQRQCLLALHGDTHKKLARARGGFATSDRTQTFTTRTVYGLESIGLLRITTLLNAHAELTAPGARLAEQLLEGDRAKAGAA
jgi:hypothetical protein